MIQFNSRQFFISFHTERYNFKLFNELSMSRMTCTRDIGCFHFNIHDSVFGPVEMGKEFAFCHTPPSPPMMSMNFFFIFKLDGFSMISI